MQVDIDQFTRASDRAADPKSCPNRRTSSLVTISGHQRAARGPEPPWQVSGRLIGEVGRVDRLSGPFNCLYDLQSQLGAVKRPRTKTGLKCRSGGNR